MNVKDRLFQIASRLSTTEPKHPLDDINVGGLGNQVVKEAKDKPTGRSDYVVTFWWSTIPGVAPKERNVNQKVYHEKQALSAKDAVDSARQKLKGSGVSQWQHAEYDVKRENVFEESEATRKSFCVHLDWVEKTEKTARVVVSAIDIEDAKRRAHDAFTDMVKNKKVEGLKMTLTQNSK